MKITKVEEYNPEAKPDDENEEEEEEEVGEESEEIAVQQLSPLRHKPGAVARLSAIVVDDASVRGSCDRLTLVTS